MAGDPVIEEAKRILQERGGGATIGPRERPTGPPQDEVTVQRVLKGRIAGEKFQETMQNPWVQRAKDLVVGGTSGAALGFAVGGPAGAIYGIAPGAAGELAAGEAERRTGSGVSGAGAGFATDLAVSALQRRPSAGLIRRANPVRRGVKQLEGTNLVRRLPRGLESRVGPEGAPELLEAVENRYGALKAVEDQAWNAWRRSVPDVTVPSDPIKRAAKAKLHRTRMKGPEAQSAAAQKALSELGDTANADDIKELMSAISDDVRIATTDPSGAALQRTAGMSEFERAIDSALDEIARHSPEGAESVRLLRTARAASKAKHQALPRESSVYRWSIGTRAGERTPEKLFQSMLSNPKETDKVIALVAGDEQAERALKRLAIDRIYGRVSGAGGAGAPRSAGAAWSKADSESRVLRKILGDKAFETVQKNNVALAKASGRGGRERMVPDIAVRGLNTGSRGAAVGVLVGHLLGTDPVTSAGAGATASYVIDSIRRKFGANAARLVALEALQDDNVMRLALAKASKNATAGERLLESLIRRGAITYMDFGELEGSPPPKASYAGGER